MPIRITVNGSSHVFEETDVALHTPILWVLRDQLGLKAAKYGCGAALCGACTIHVNGLATRACVTPLRTLDGASITTLEGISSDGRHPVQEAWRQVEVPQCGYCQAGQMMSACALLAKTPEPTEEQIDSAMEGNLCRCGTYLRIRKAIHLASLLAARRKKAE